MHSIVIIMPVVGGGEKGLWTYQKYNKIATLGQESVQNPHFRARDGQHLHFVGMVIILTHSGWEKTTNMPINPSLFPYDKIMADA